jgi:hypothetical protein
MTAINQIVNVSAFYFQNGRGLRSFPRQIEFGNTRCTFQDGLQYSIHNGEHLVKLYDMTDGRTNYRLRLEDDTWTLVGTRTLS